MLQGAFQPNSTWKLDNLIVCDRSREDYKELVWHTIHFHHKPQAHLLAIIVGEHSARLSEISFLRIRSHDESDLAPWIRWNVDGRVINFGENFRASAQYSAYKRVVKPVKEFMSQIDQPLLQACIWGRGSREQGPPFCAPRIL